LLCFSAGYPLITYFTRHPLSTIGGFNIGGINATGQVAHYSSQIPSLPGNWGLIDVDTPQSAYTTTSTRDGSELQLVFSDEFNTEGRTFYPGDDPFWEAVDLHYWAVSKSD
jgi:beta-glucanase (GH16 family)